MKSVEIWCAVVISLVCVSQVSANTLTFASSMEYSGATPPVGAAPWLTATFDDHGTSGSVTLTLAAANLTGNEFASEWDFNIDTALESSVGSLLFSEPTKVGAFSNPTIGTIANFFQADGDGKYDISFGFATSDGASSRFGVGDSATYTITGIPTLTASSFNFLSSPAGGHGPYTTAAHVQGIAVGAGSGWVTVPEPSTFVLFAASAVGLLTWASRRRR